MVSIVIVDDSKAARMMMAHWIKAVRPTWSIHEAASGEDALVLRTDADPDHTIWLLDYNMPGMSGIEVAEKLLENFPACNIVLCTANIQDAIQRKAENLGLGFIKKPMTPDKINQIVHRMET